MQDLGGHDGGAGVADTAPDHLQPPPPPPPEHPSYGTPNLQQSGSETAVADAMEHFTRVLGAPAMLSEQAAE